MEEQDLFPEMTGFTLPTQAVNILKSQNYNVTKFQQQINDDIAAGGKQKNGRIQQTFQLLDNLLGGTYYTERLSAAMPLTQKEVANSFGNATGKQNFFGNLWNNSVPALIEGAGKLGAALPAIIETDDKDWNARNQSVEAFVRPMLTYVDESFKNLSPVAWNREKGELDLSNLTSANAWANAISTTLGFMAPMLATAGVGAVARGLSTAGKVATGFSEVANIAELAANGAKLDKFGKAMLGVEFTTSSAMMFPEYQKMGIDNGLSIGEATKFALPLSIVNGAIELIGGEALAKGLGFTTAEANKVIREVTKQNAGDVLAALRTGAKLDDAAFQDVIEQVAKNTVSTLADKSQYPIWKKIGGKVFSAARDQGIAEGSEEFLQASTEEIAKALYNSTADPSLPEGRGRFEGFDPREYATNAIFGTLLGGLMGTSMGLFHKNPKAFDQTLFNYVAADVQTQMGKGAQSFDEIIPNLKAYALSQKGLTEGIYDQAEKDKIDTKIANMAQVAYEFAQSPEVGKPERYAMYRLTQTQNELTDTEASLAAAREEITALGQQMDSGNLSPKQLIDANARFDELQSQLGSYDPDNDVYEAESALIQKKAFAQKITKESAKAMAAKDEKVRSSGSRYLQNELSKISDEQYNPQLYSVSPEGIVVLESDGKAKRISRAVAVPVQPPVLTDDVLQGDYTPAQRMEIQPAGEFQGVDDFVAAEGLFTTGRKISDPDQIQTSPLQDASDVIALGQEKVRQLGPSDPEAELKPVWDYYQKIQEYDKDGKFGVKKYNSAEDFYKDLGLVSEQDAVDAEELGVAPEQAAAEVAASAQPESLELAEPEVIASQAADTNEFYDEGLVEAQIEAFVAANGIEPEISIPQWVDIAIRRAESALPMQPMAIKEASDYLYKVYKQWSGMKRSSSRMYTIAQIDEMLELIGSDIELLQQYLNAYEDGTAAQFAGRNQETGTSPDTTPAVQDSQPSTPATEQAENPQLISPQDIEQDVKLEGVLAVDTKPSVEQKPLDIETQAADTNEFYDESLVEAQIEAFVKANGIEPEILIPSWVDIAIRRTESALPIQPLVIKEASDYLYKVYKQWVNMKRATSRMYTIAQINEMLGLIGGDIELLQNYLSAYEEGVAGEFQGRTQEEIVNIISDLPKKQLLEPNEKTIDAQAGAGSGQTTPSIESQLIIEQERAVVVEQLADNVKNADVATKELDDAVQEGEPARVDATLRKVEELATTTQQLVDQIDPDVATQSSDPNSGPERVTEAEAVRQITAKQVRRKLEELRRVPQSFREAVLWYFADGGQVRREDVLRFVGEGAISSGKGGNAYLSYITDRADPYDTILYRVVESMGYNTISEVGDENVLLDELFTTFLEFYGTSPNRLLLQLLLEENKAQYEPMFGESEIDTNELAAYFSVDEDTLNELSTDDIEEIEAFLRTLPNTIDPTNPQQVFDALIAAKDGFPPLSENAMSMIEAIVADSFVSDPTQSEAFKQSLKPIIDNYNESVRQANSPTTETSTTGSAPSNNQSQEQTTQASQSRSEKLDTEAEAITNALKEKFARFAKAGRSSASSSIIGVTPEQFEIAGEIVADLSKLGINRFQKAISWVADNMGMDFLQENFLSFQSAYVSVKIANRDFSEDFNEIGKASLEQILNSQENVPSTTIPVESDSARGGIANPVGTKNVSTSDAGVLPPTGNGGGVTSEAGVSFASNQRIPDGVSVTVGGERDPDLSPQERNDVVAERNARFDERSRSSSIDVVGLSTEQPGATTTPSTVSGEDSRAAKLEKQRQAEAIPVQGSTLENIVDTLPYLLPHQHSNVQKAEVRLIEQGEKGILFTDGTGTGKTLTALGIAKRFLKRGAKNILIVTPSDKKIKDWVEEASILGINASGLTGLTDAGQGVSVTTYANFGQNEAIAKRKFDLVIYDESHNLVSNENGKDTLALRKHKDITHPPLTAFYTARAEFSEALSDLRTQRSDAERLRQNERVPEINAKIRQIEDVLVPNRAKELIEQTKVVFLSATPFAYHKNIPYADGFLFKAYEQLDSNYKPLGGSSGYNSGDEMDKYMMAAFGYRMRYNKLTMPETGVDVGLMERNWIESLKKSGAVSSTKLDIPQDYSREFVLLSEEKQKYPIGALIDEGWRIINDGEEFKNLAQALNKKLDYLYKNRLLEQIKVRLGVQRIKKHIEAGRKVVVFHSYNEGISEHPFDFSFLGTPLVSIEESVAVRAVREAELFNAKYPQYAKIDLSGMGSVPSIITKEFGDKAVLFNGSVPAKKRSENIKKFNDDTSDTSIVVVNIAAGEAGLNLHDTTGKHQRVVVQLGLPVRPTSAIQSEGRIYRTGQKTNAVFEYFVTHFNFEKYAFGSKINERSGTAENLAMGNEARDLKVSFKEGYLNPITEDPSDTQGVGGKSRDYSLNEMTAFKKALTYYYARQKKNASTKSAEGTDYFATPEPLGLKMVEWLEAVAGDALLEPSAGHGAIARFFPDSTNNIMVEPSTVLRSDLTVNAHGTTIGGTFEQLSIVNKFDGIAMNPPFGASAKTAMEHLEKAVKHLRDGGRLVALVPVGQMDKRLEKYLYSLDEKGKPVYPDAKNLHLSARVLLPSATFERAGTGVMTQILVFDKVVDEAARNTLPPTRNIDLRSAANANEFFERIEDLTVPSRNRTGQGESQTSATTTTSQSIASGANENQSSESLKAPVKGFHAKSQRDTFVVQTSGKLSDDEYKRVRGISTKFSGYYSSFKDNKGAIPGFQFQTIEQAREFYKAVTGKDAPATQMMYGPETTTTQPTSSPIATRNTIELLSQRFDGQVVFRTPTTEEEFLQKQKEYAPDSRQAAWGFYNPVTREVWLNPAQSNVNTPIHEVAHPWVSWTKTNNPALYQRGIELVRDSFYFRDLLRDPNYQGLSVEELAEEALVRAIADKGERFVTPIRKRGFLEWFTELFDSIKQFLGIRELSADEIANLSLEQFANMAAADILAGQNTSIVGENTAGGELSDAAVLAPLFSFGKNTYDFSGTGRADVKTYQSWQQHIDYAMAMIPVDVLVKKAREFTSQDERLINQVFEKTGVKYKGDGDWEFDLSKSPDTAFLGDGTLVRMDRYGQASAKKGIIATTFRNGFLKMYNKKGWDGDVFRMIVKGLRGLLNIETMAALLDDGSGIITSLISDVKRVGGRNKAYISNILAPKRYKIAQAAKDFTIAQGVNNIWTTKRVEVETFGWDEATQDIVKRRVEIPIATAMSMVLTADTQESMGDTYGGTSLVLPDRFIDQNGDMIDFAQSNPNLTPDQLVKLKKSVIYSDSKNVHRGAKLIHSALEKQANDFVEIENMTLLLAPQQLQTLRDRFVNGINITSDAETEVFSLLKDAFNDRRVRDKLKQEDEQFLNYGEEFKVIPDYFPISSADGQTQINDRIKYRPALEDARILNERISAPKSVYVGDALDTLEDYEYRVGNIMEHGRLSHNITTIMNALKTEVIDDPMVREVTSWLKDRRELIEDWRGYKKSRQDSSAFSWVNKPVSLLLSRYTSSIFRLNFGMATKQLATFASAAGQSMLKDEYLFKAEGFKNLLTLSRGMITDTVTGVGQEIVEGTDIGFVDKLGNKSTQADIIRELLGEDIVDPAERELHRQRFATVIERILYSQNAYVGGVDFDKVTFNSKGMQLLSKVFGRADDWMENIGMTPMRISDRAVILSYYLAAKEQVSDEVAAGEIQPDEYNQRVAEVLESVLYATNQMAKVADMTTMQTSTNWLTKLLGLYSGQTQKLLNVFLQAFLNKVHNPGNKAAQTRLRKAFISNVIIVPIYLAGVTTVWSMLKAIANGDEPKEYDYYKEQFMWNVARNMTSIVPGLAEQTMTMIISNIDNEPWSDSLFEYPGDEILNSSIKSVADLYQWGAASDSEEAGKYADSFYYDIEKSFSGWTGTPKVVTRFVREHTTTDEDDK